MDYSEKRRHDPEIRAEVERIHEARKAMLVKAAGVLQELWHEMQELDGYGDRSIYQRCVDTLWGAKHRIGEDADFLQKIGGETYVGNLAAGWLGEQVAREMGRK